MNKITYNPESYMESEIVSDKTLGALLSFIAESQDVYDALDYNDADAVKNFTHVLAEKFAQKNALNAQQKIFIESILNDRLSFDHDKNSVQRQAYVENDSHKNERNLDRMKEIVQPNLASAAINYIKFVQPFEEDKEKYARELAIFRKHQMKYLAEDIGIMNPHEQNVAMDALMELLPEETARLSLQQSQNIADARDDVIQDSVAQKNKKEIDHSVKKDHAVPDAIEDFEREKIIIKKQKDLVGPLVLPTVRTFKEIPQDDEERIEKFWYTVAQNLREVSDLQGADMDKAIAGLRFIVEERARKEGLQTQQAVMQENVQNQMSRDFEFDGMVFTGETGEILHQLYTDMMEKEKIVKEKTQKLRTSYDVVEQGGIGQTMYIDESVKIFEEDLDAARHTFEYALKNAREELEVVDVIEKNIEKSVDAGIHTYDAKTIERASSMSEKIKGIVAKVSDWYRTMPQITKRIAVSTFLLAGLITGGIVGQNYDNAPIISDTQQTHVVYAQNSVDNKTLDNSHISVDNDVSDIAAVTESIDDVRAERVVRDTIVVKKGGSIEAAIASGLIKHHVQIMQERGDDSEMDDAQVAQWAGASAHRMAQAYKDVHPGIAIDRVNPGTKVYLDLGDPQNIFVDIAFVGGPHIAPDHQKNVVEKEHVNHQAEIAHIRELLKKTEFKTDVKNQLKNIFVIKDVQEFKEIAMSPLQKFFEKGYDEEMQNRLSTVIENAEKIYGSVGMPSQNTRVQNYFVRLYARAQRDGIVEQIFTV